MWELSKALEEILSVLNTILIMTALLDFVIVFLLSLIVLYFFNLSWHYASIPAGIYFIYHTIKNMSKARFKTVEEKYPPLREELRTAADNISNENEILEKLNRDVVLKMKDLKVSYFMDFNTIFYKVMLIFCLSFIIIFLGSLNLKTINLPHFIQDQQFKFELKTKEPIPESLLEEGDITDLYGEKREIKLGKNDIKLTINPVETDIDINDVKPIKDQFFLVTFPDDIRATTESSFEEDISKENKKVVKTYFKKLTER